MRGMSWPSTSKRRRRRWHGSPMLGPRRMAKNSRMLTHFGQPNTWHNCSASSTRRFVTFRLLLPTNFSTDRVFYMYTSVSERIASLHEPVLQYNPVAFTHTDLMLMNDLFNIFLVFSVFSTIFNAYRVSISTHYKSLGASTSLQRRQSANMQD